MRRNGHHLLLLLGSLWLVGCQQVPLGKGGATPEEIEVQLNGRTVRSVDTLDLLPHLGVSGTELDTLRFLQFRLESEGDLNPLLFLGYAQEVTISGYGPPVRIGTLVAENVSGGRPEAQFFHRQEGYAPHLPLKLKAGQALDIQLTFHRIVEKKTPRAVTLMSPAYLKRYTNYGFSHFANGIFQGMIWILILYHLLLYWSVREVSYLYYCAYMLSISALTLGDAGYWQRGVFKNLPILGWHLFQLFQYVTGIMTLVFMRRFVDLKRLNPRWDRIVYWFIVGNLVVLALLAAWYFPTRDGRGLLLVKVLIIPFAAFGLWVCYALLRSGDVVGRYFAVAGAFTAIAVAVNAGVELFFPEHFPGTNFTRFYWIQVAVILHLLTFALGMGYRRRQKDLELQRTREMDVLKTRFYTNITHEFRTPLTVILGMAEQLKSSSKARNLIERNAQQLLRLINQLLGLSRLEAQQVQAHYGHGEVVAFLRYVTESFHSLAADKELKLTFYSEEEEIWMDYDEEKLQHIVFNLLSNAIKFTPAAGEVVLHLARVDEREGPRLQLKVRDTGVGIPTETLAQVFDRFFQVDGGSTREEEGTGIGLAYTQELVRLLEGEIDVSSQVGKGTTFRVLLPIRAEAARKKKSNTIPSQPVLPGLGVSEEVTNFAPASAPEKKDEQQALILLVDDNTDVLAYVAGLLEKEYHLQCAKDGEAGLMAAREHIPDLIISDIMMPRMNGYELSKQLRQDQRTSHVPIILLTAKVTQADKLAGLENGADVFLTKPFDKNELLVRIENLLESRRKLRHYYAQGALPLVSDALRPDPEAAFLQELETAILERMEDPDFGVPQLAQTVAMSQSQVYRKLKALVGKTPSQFIRGVRLRKGRTLLADPSLNIAEVAYTVGFADPNYFSRMFNEAFGSSPSDWRRKRGISST